MRWLRNELAARGISDLVEAIDVSGEIRGSASRKIEIGKDELLAVYRRCQSMAELAEAIGVSRPTAARLLREHGIPVYHPRMTPDVEAQILKMRRDGHSYRAISAVMGVPLSTVYNAVKRAEGRRRPSTTRSPGRSERHHDDSSE